MVREVKFGPARTPFIGVSGSMAVGESDEGHERDAGTVG